MKKCKTKGCGTMTEHTRCAPCADTWNAAEKQARAETAEGKRKCQKCYQTGHRADTCTWEPSIYKGAPTPAQAAKARSTKREAVSA